METTHSEFHYKSDASDTVVIFTHGILGSPLQFDFMIEKLSGRFSIESLLVRNKENLDPMTLVEQVVVPALERIGTGWEQGRISLAQVYLSGRICEEMIDKLLPPDHTSRKRQPPMAIVVLEDHHLLGKRIVYSAMRASGFELFNYGQMDVDTVVSKVKTDGIKILLISVLMLPSALRIKTLRESLIRENLDIKLLVGGAPFRYDKLLWQEVGADAMGANPAEAVEWVRKISGDIQ
jgi:methanogenic corrinoid protein MtbC1